MKKVRAHILATIFSMGVLHAFMYMMQHEWMYTIVDWYNEYVQPFPGRSNFYTGVFLLVEFLGIFALWRYISPAVCEETAPKTSKTGVTKAERQFQRAWHALYK